MAFTEVNGSAAFPADVLREMRERAEKTKSEAEVARLGIADLSAWCEELEKADAALAESGNQVADEIRKAAEGMGADIRAINQSLDNLFVRAREAGVLTDAMNTRLTLVEARPVLVPPPPPPRIDLSPFAAKSRVETLAADIAAARAATEAVEMTVEKETRLALDRAEAAEYRMWLMFWAILANTVVSLLTLWGAH
jgi:hypothetical protein